MRRYIYTVLLVAYFLGLPLLFISMAALGIDVRVNGQYFVTRLASRGLLILILSAPALVLIVLIRREMRRKRLPETSPH
jgi:hypothetical protein